jgi:hypothetical protein
VPSRWRPGTPGLRLDIVGERCTQRSEASPNSPDRAFRSLRERACCLKGDCNPDLEPGLESFGNLARAEMCRPSYAISWRGEADQFWNSAEEASRGHCGGHLPLLVTSQDPNNPQSSQAPPIRPIWNSLQEHLKTLSPRSRRVIARSSGHDRPAGCRHSRNPANQRLGGRRGRHDLIAIVTH